MEGVVKWFNFQKGYGFITPTGDEKDVFLHKTSLEKISVEIRTRMDIEGLIVRYRIEDDSFQLGG